MIDLHVHTSRCGHGEGDLADYVASARRARLDVLGFCDHLPLPPGFPAGYAMKWSELPTYVREVSSLARRAPVEGGPEILLGIEADWIPGRESLISGATEVHPFDLVLGSVHFIDDWAFDDPDQQARYAEWPIDALWERYFDDLAAAASTGLFDVMAHPDLIKKFGERPATDPLPWYEQTADVLAGTGVAVEVNSAGLRKPCAEIYPSLEFLQACRSRGVPATMGSDAHRPEDVGEGLQAAHDLLVEAGYDSVLVFRRRRAEEVAL